ncbi:hypothetical protein PLESTB_000986900 [Pleodorina starrii]|uniref:Cyclic nucleotide-binding domain-containing protein n=1 Tax=Pleodorina starrii TaxID=330485 RepID=A0A9W6BP64_9CHLO|nr:hypothetical protein PLESTB_000986900 [Pleodorina starrii]
MPHFLWSIPGLSSHHAQPVTKGPRELQTVQEADYERQTLQPDTPNDDLTPSGGGLRLEPNPSQRPLGRVAHDPAETFGRNNEALKRSIYAQEGDVQPSEFKETVAELLKEEEYGIFRLFVPSVELDRQEFDDYVTWLNVARAPGGKGALRRSIYGLPVLPPFSVPALAWTSLMTLVDLTWTAFGVPINVAFCSVDYGRLHSGCTASDLVFGRWVARFYISPFHGRFMLDLAAIVPFGYLIAVLVMSKGHGYQAKWVNAVSLIRLIRLLRLVTVSRVIYIDSALGADVWLSRYMRVSSLYVCMIAFQILVLINLFACVLVLLAYMHGLDNSWMTAISWTDVPDSSRFYQWYCAVYWVVTTTTTTGFGDFSPRWWAEQVVIGCAMVGGMLAFGVLVGSVANALARADVNASRLQSHIKKISQVNKWLSTVTKEQLPRDLQGRIQAYFAGLYVAKQSVKYGEAELFADLPPFLRSEVASGLTLELVQKVHGFSALNKDAQQFIAAHLRPLRAVEGQELCRQGDEADRLWLLASGELVALRHKEQPQHVAAPALVGESLALAMDIPQCRHRPWTLRAALPCQLWELRLEDLSRVIQIYPAVRLCLLDHVRKELVKSLWSFEREHRGESAELEAVSAGQDWCELSSLLHDALLELQGVDPGALDALCQELIKATVEDGSLQARLSEIVDAAMVRDGLTPEALLGLPLQVQAQAAAVQQLQRQTLSATSDRGLSANGGSGAWPSGAPSGAAGPNAGPWPRGGGSGELQALRRGATTGGGGGGGYRREPPMHDPHHGPAPWGVTTEDALASGGRFGNQPPPPQPPPQPQQQPTQPPSRKQRQQQQQQLLSKDSSRSWHGRASPPRPGTAMLPMPPQPQPHRFRRVSSYHQGLHDAGGGGGGDGRGGGGGGGGPDTDFELQEVTGSGLWTPEARVSRQPTATAPPPGAAPHSPSSPLEILNDPIADETGVLSPKVQQRLQQQQQEREQPRQGQEAQQGQQAEASPLHQADHDSTDGRADDETAPAAGAPAAAAAAAAAAGSSGGRNLPGPLPPTGHGLRRSILSRMSTPFSTATATADVAVGGGGATAAAVPAVTPAGTTSGGGGGSGGVVGAGGAGGGSGNIGGGGGGGSGSGPPSAERRQGRPAGPNGSCTACGAHFCAQCGAWVPTLQPHHHQGQGQASLTTQPALTAIGPGSAPLVRSLIDAIRGRQPSVTGGGGGGGGAAAAAAAAANTGNLIRRSAVPWASPPWNNGPPSPRNAPWAGGGGGGGGGAPGSPTGVLARRSRMYGRSFAATARADSLVRNTLMRDTLWNAYSQREEDELASPSVPVPVRAEDY